MFTKKTSYGIRGLVNLARKNPGKSVLVKSVSMEEQIPRSFLNKIFQKLKRAGILESKRGVGGGFQLARSPKRITLKEIIEVLEGKFVLSRSFIRKTDNSDQLDEVTMSVFDKARSKLEKLFEGTTLYDLIRRKR